MLYRELNGKRVFMITEDDIQDEAVERWGRKMSYSELQMAMDWIEEGLGGLAYDITLDTIFSEVPIYVKYEGDDYEDRDDD